MVVDKEINVMAMILNILMTLGNNYEKKGKGKVVDFGQPKTTTTSIKT